MPQKAFKHLMNRLRSFIVDFTHCIIRNSVRHCVNVDVSRYGIKQRYY